MKRKKEDSRKITFSVLDLLIVLVLVVTGAVWTYRNVAPETEEDVPVETQVQVQGAVLHEEYAQALTRGQIVFGKNGKRIGKVTDIAYSDGEGVRLCTLTLRLTGEVPEVNDEFLLDTEKLILRTTVLSVENTESDNGAIQKGGTP